jgi:hypothetical protein
MSGTDVLTSLRLEGGDLTAHSYQDVEDIIARNKALRGQAQRSDWGRHVACIPNNIILAWLQEEWARGNSTMRLFGPEFDALVARKLRDPDWAYLRTDK